MQKKKIENPIVEVYRGVSIRKYPLMFIRPSIPEAKKIIDARLDFGLSLKNAIKSKKVFCYPCNEFKKDAQ